ncbi:MAG: cation transporter [Clostridia bacterium]|nr:cation transporter [Clostridia bacterium]
MKKSIKLEDLDCANCAAKLENAVAAIDGVQRVTVSFMAQKMILEAPDDKFDEIMKQVVKTAKKVVPEATVIV